MTSISTVNNTAALTVLRSGQNASSVEGFLGSSNFKASSPAVFKGILTAFAENPSFVEQFNKEFKKQMEWTAPDGSHIHPNNASHNALIEVIMANRDAFPPGEFEIHTNLPDGASMHVTIPSAEDVKLARFAEDVAAKQKAYDDAVAAKEAAETPDPEAVKLKAMADVVKTLVLDSAQQETGETTSAPQAILAKPYLDEKKDAA